MNHAALNQWNIIVAAIALPLAVAEARAQRAQRFNDSNWRLE